jgi:hypothetical protein
VASQQGVIRLLQPDLTVAPAPFLDLSEAVLFDGNERGLLGLAFHPRFPETGWLFVDYTREGDGATVVARYRVSADPDRADPASGVTLLVVPQPFANHNGGQLAFGPDGYLYIGMGDGGGAGDPQCRAQKPEERLGKLLRIDVDAHSGSAPYYGIPAGNPYAGAHPGADEVWAIGLRNPWRFSFDRRFGFLYLADVGQQRRDEIDILPPDQPGGANFGWKVMEGSLCYSRDGCPGSTPSCGADELFLPEVENDITGSDCALIGGYVYRGLRLPELSTRYLFGDFCSGRLWTLRSSAGGLVRDPFPWTLPLLTTFGEGRTGELWMGTLDGWLYALDRPVSTACVAGPERLCLGAGGRFEAEVVWRTAEGFNGPGQVVPGADRDSGLFWFFFPENWELLVKVLDGCGVNARFWVYGAAATDVEYLLRVTDTVTGQVREYWNPLGTRAAALTDPFAFPTCP